MHWRFWRRGQRAEILAALSLVLSQRRPLIPGLEALAASDPGLQHLLVPLMTALRRGGEIHLNQTLYKLGYLDAEESRLLELAMAQDRTHECLESLSWRQRVGGVNMALIRWFPVWIVLSMLVGYGIFRTVLSSYILIFRELRMKISLSAEILLNPYAFCTLILLTALFFFLWIRWRERRSAGPGSAAFWCYDLIPKYLLLRIVQETRWNHQLPEHSPVAQSSRKHVQKAWGFWLRKSRWRLDPVLKSELIATQDSMERLRRLGFFSSSSHNWDRIESELSQELQSAVAYRNPIFLGLILLIGVMGLPFLVTIFQQFINVLCYI